MNLITYYVRYLRDGKRNMAVVIAYSMEDAKTVLHLTPDEKKDAIGIQLHIAHRTEVRRIVSDAE